HACGAPLQRWSQDHGPVRPRGDKDEGRDASAPRPSSSDLGFDWVDQRRREAPAGVRRRKPARAAAPTMSRIRQLSFDGPDGPLSVSVGGRVIFGVGASVAPSTLWLDDDDVLTEDDSVVEVDTLVDVALEELELEELELEE